MGRPRPRGCRATEKRNEFPSPHGPCPQAEAGTLAYRMGAFASQQNGTLDFRDGSTSDISTALIHVRFTPESGHSSVQLACPLWANSGHSNRSALAKRRTPGRGALIVKRLRGHSRSLPLPALAEQAGCGETANQPQKMYPYVMRLTLNHDGCD